MYGPRNEASLFRKLGRAGQRPRFSSAFRKFNNTQLRTRNLAVEAARRRKMSLSFTDNINSFNTNVNVSQVSNHYAAPEDQSEILAWLSPLEPRIRHQDIRTRRADKVGEWVLQTDEFRRWCDGTQWTGPDYATLFCCGGPAVGKTYLR